MKHSTFRKSSLISSVALLLVAIVALSGATFAWFSTQTYANASAINATTSKSSGLVLSHTGEGGWEQSLDISASSKSLTPVTPVAVTYDEDDNEVITMDPETSKPAAITDLSSAAWKKATAASWDAQVASGEYDEAAANTDYIVKRIYIKALGAAESEVAIKADLSVTADYSSEAQADFYRAAIVPVTDTKAASIATDATQYIYSVEDYDRAATATYGNYASSVNKDDIALGTIEAEKVYAYDVYVWFEGEDADCKDTYYENDITLSIKFE